MATYFPSPSFVAFPAVIASSGTTSGEQDLDGNTLCGLMMPAAFTGVAITFLVSLTTGGTFNALTKDDGSAYSVTVAASKYVALDYTKFAGVRYVKIVSGSSEGADRTVNLVARKLA